MSCVGPIGGWTLLHGATPPPGPPTASVEEDGGGPGAVEVVLRGPRLVVLGVEGAERRLVGGRGARVPVQARVAAVAAPGEGRPPATRYTLN